MNDLGLNLLSDLFGVVWCSFMALHFLSSEESRGRRLLLKIFARWIEVPLLWFIWVVCQGPLKFLTEISVFRNILGAAVARPFALYMDTGVPIPTKDLKRLIEKLDGPIAVGDCRCGMAKKTCGHPMRRDIVFRTGHEAFTWAFPDNFEEISKDEAVRIIEDCSARGMFQMVFIHCSTQNHLNEYVICNCCPCGCKVHLLNRTVGQEYFPLRDGGFRSRHYPEKCEKCGDCVDKCPFNAISMSDDGIKTEDCFGCGVCERACEKGAYTVTQDLPGPPWAQEAWRILEEGDGS